MELELEAKAARDKKDVLRYGSYSAVAMLAAQAAQFRNVFYTEQLKITPTVVGSVILAASIIDFIMSFFVGGIMEKARFKSGKYIPWVRNCRYFIYLGNLCVFLPFEMPITVRYALMIIGYLLIQIPTAFLTTSQYGALNLACGADINKRNRMAALGIRLGQFVSVFTTATTTLIRGKIGEIVGNQYRDFILALVYPLFYFVTSWLMLGLLKQYDKPVEETASGPARPSITVKDMVQCVVTNDQFVVNMISTLLFFIGMLSPAQIVMYYYIYVRNDPKLTLFALAQTITMVAGFVTAMIGPSIGMKMGRKPAMILGMTITTISSTLMMLFGHLHIAVFIGLNCVTSFANSCYSVFGFSYLIDVGEYGYWKTGKDNRIVIQSLSNVPMKVAGLVGGSVAMFGLAIIGYKAGEPMDATMIKRFMYLYGGLPAICNGLACLDNLFFYKIGDKEAQKYASENREREAAAKAAAEAATVSGD